MGDVGGPRHYTAITPAQAAWKCPHCRTSNTTRLEDGCPVCGVGTPEANARAQTVSPLPVDLPVVTLGALVGQIQPQSVAAFVALQPYTYPARMTIARALAFAAEQGMAAMGEGEGLKPHEMIAWAREIVRVAESSDE